MSFDLVFHPYICNPFRPFFTCMGWIQIKFTISTMAVATMCWLWSVRLFPSPTAKRFDTIKRINGLWSRDRNVASMSKLWHSYRRSSWLLSQRTNIKRQHITVLCFDRLEKDAPLHSRLCRQLLFTDYCSNRRYHFQQKFKKKHLRKILEMKQSLHGFLEWGVIGVLGAFWGHGVRMDGVLLLTGSWLRDTNKWCSRNRMITELPRIIFMI